MTSEDLKQKADTAWKHPSGTIRACVDASIAAALSPVLERVERLEAMQEQPPGPCTRKFCQENYPHTHAPDTGWIRPWSWDYEHNRPRHMSESKPPAPCPTGKPALDASGKQVDVFECRHCGGPVDDTRPYHSDWRGLWHWEGECRKPSAPCATCGGAGFVCDSGKASWGKLWPCMNEDPRSSGE